MNTIKNKAALLFSNPRTFNEKAKKHLFSTAYSGLEFSKDVYVLANVILKILKAILGRETLRTGFIGSSLLQFSEMFADCGCIYESAYKCFFENDPTDILHPYNDIESLDPTKFDLLFLGIDDVQKKEKILNYLRKTSTLFIDLPAIVRIFHLALRSIKERHFQSCLNLNKLATIAFFTYLCPPQHNIIEAGAYQCGTTILMAKIAKLMGKELRIYALDTFCGMPSASQKDLDGELWYDAGLFTNTDVKSISRRIKKEGVDQRITLCPGLVQETLPSISASNKDIFFMFLDTDQYAGTKSGLEAMALRENPSWFVLIDDTNVAGVDLAINEFLAKNTHLKRKNLFYNLDILYSDKTDFNLQKI